MGWGIGKRWRKCRCEARPGASRWARPRGALWVALLCTLGTACSVTRSVRPVGKGAWVAGASLGGPLTEAFGPPLPLPIGTVFGRYGVGARTDVDVGLMLPTVRAAGLDAGLSHLVVDTLGWRPAVMVGGRVAVFANPWGLAGQRPLAPRVLEEVHATASWLSGPWKPYLGADLALQVEHLRAVPTLSVGVDWTCARRWHLALEGRWFALASRPRGALPHWVGVGGLGALGVQVGVAYHFSGT